MAFVDFLSNSTIRNAFLSGECSFVLNSKASALLWLDGAAASFFGFSTLVEALDRDEFFDDAVKRQIENGVKSGCPVRLRGQNGAACFLVSVINHEKMGKVIFARQKNPAKLPDTGAQDILSHQPSKLLNGLADKNIAAAIFDDHNDMVAATESFVSPGEELKILLYSIDGFSPVRTMMKQGQSLVEVNAICLQDKPRFFLVLSSNITNSEEQEPEGEDGQSHPQKPVRFTWKMDRNGFFTEFSDEFIKLGGDTQKLVGKNLADLEDEVDNDGFSQLANKIVARSPWQDVDLVLPVKNDYPPLEVKLSGLPVFSNDDELQGFRGFAIVQSYENRKTKSAIALQNSSTEILSPNNESQSQVNGDPSLGDKTAIELSVNDQLSWKDQPQSAHQPSGEVENKAALTDSERSAFREIAERLRNELQLPAIDRPLAKADSLETPVDQSQLTEETYQKHETHPGHETHPAEDKPFMPERISLLNLLDTATDGVAFLDKDGHICGFSAAASALTGYDESDVMSRPFASLFRPSSEEAIKNYLATLQSGGSKRLFNRGEHAEIRTKSGEEIRIFVTLVPLSYQQGYAGLLRDMTAVPNALQPIYDNESLAQTIHEIRTPLNAMIGFADIMREGRFGRIENERYRGYLRDIIVSGKHILTLVNRFLEKAKSRHDNKNHDLTAENPPAIVASFDVIQQLRKSVALLENLANDNGITIRMTMPPKIPSIRIDAQEFRQIILNLLSNAIRFTPSGGQIGVHLDSTDGKFVKLSISDNGVGMNEEEMARALQPYGQVARKDGRSGDAVFVGTGLGLPTTKGLVEKNGGRFILLSKPDQGTTAELFFPIARS